MKVGLTLSGGGARGAYEAGVVKALAQCGVRVDAVSGASIGALNGSIVATSPTLKVAGERLELLWRMLADEKVIEFNMPSYMTLLGSARGFMLKGPLWWRGVIGVYACLSGRKIFESWLRTGAEFCNSSLLSNDPLRKKLEEWVPSGALAKGLPLYVSVFRSLDEYDIPLLLGAIAGFADTPDSEYLLVQELTEEDQYKALWASATLPFLYASQVINGKAYVDGGLGGWNAETGNTPVEPLVQAGCDLVLVSLASDGSFWDRSRYPQTAIIEIRPHSTMGRQGKILDMLGFNESNINEWIDMGYHDAMLSMERIMQPLEIQGALGQAVEDLRGVLKEEQDSFENMQSVMKNLKR